jgi:hypothetical protein
MSVSHVMSATSVRSNIPVPIWPSSLTAQLNVYEKALATVDWNMSAYLSVCCAPHGDQGPRTKTSSAPSFCRLEKSCSIYGPRPRVKPVATETVQLQTAESRKQKADRRPQ